MRQNGKKAKARHCILINWQHTYFYYHWSRPRCSLLFIFLARRRRRPKWGRNFGLPLLHYYHYIHMCWLLVFEGALNETEFIYFDIRLLWFNYIYIPLLTYISWDTLRFCLFLLYELSITYSFGILHCMKYNCFIQRNAEL